MPKNIVLVLIALLVALGVGTSLYLFSQRKSFVVSPTPSEKESSNVSDAVPSQKLRQYRDDAGFTVAYPEDLTLKKNETKETVVYADISLTSSQRAGSTMIKVADTTFTSLNAWLKANKEFLLASSSKDVTLGELPAREVKTATKMVTAAIDQGVLFIIETVFEEQEPFWLRVHRETTSRFTFSSSQESTSGGSASSGEEISIEEEIIE